MKLTYKIISILFLLLLIGIIYYSLNNNFVKKSNKIIKKKKVNIKINRDDDKKIKKIRKSKNNNTNISIKKYKDLNTNEIKIIHDIWHICFPELDDNSVLDMGFFNKSLVWLFKNNEKIIGYVCILESIDFIEYLNEMGIKNSELYSLKNWNGIFINNLCIIPEYRKKGMANKLINIIEKWAVNNKKDYLHLLVNSDNEPAYKLYLKNKYKIDQENLNPETNVKVYTMIKYLNNNL